MSTFTVNMTAINPKDENRCTPPVEVVVDTGAELSWLPRKILSDIGITSRGKLNFSTATNQIIEREYGYAILSAEGFAAPDEVVFGEDEDASLMGVRTIEGFGVMVDNIDHRFVPVTQRRV